MCDLYFWFCLFFRRKRTFYLKIVDIITDICTNAGLLNIEYDSKGEGMGENMLVELTSSTLVEYSVDERHRILNLYLYQKC